jgi:hypothetical protein
MPPLLTEHDIHRAIAQHLNTRPVIGLVWFHVPNGGWRQHTEAARFVGLGVKPGVADLIFLCAGQFFALED